MPETSSSPVFLGGEVRLQKPSGDFIDFVFAFRITANTVEVFGVGGEIYTLGPDVELDF